MECQKLYSFNFSEESNTETTEEKQYAGVTPNGHKKQTTRNVQWFHVSGNSLHIYLKFPGLLLKVRVAKAALYMYIHLNPLKTQLKEITRWLFSVTEPDSRGPSIIVLMKHTMKVKIQSKY